MNYCEIKNCDIANGPGVRISLFVSGCRNRCPHCFQPETWDFGYGEPFTAETADRIADMMKPSYINGLTVLGGEPFEPENQIVLEGFLRGIRKAYPDKNIWMYTGFTWEELHTDTCRCRCGVTDSVLGLIDVLVDGRYEEDKKNIRLRFRGSENQRLIDVPKSLEKGIVVPAEN